MNNGIIVIKVSANSVSGKLHESIRLHNSPTQFGFF